MLEGWMSLGGTEIVNSERYAAYAVQLGLPVPHDWVRCRTLPAVLADEPYETDGVAGAPWYDPAAPESAGFAGVFVESVTGLSSATSTRPITDLAAGGAAPGQGRNTARTMLVTALLAATTDLSLRYGLAWLDAVLRDDCGGQCEGATLCMVAACPDCATAPSELADQCWVDHARTLHDVTCVDGPNVVRLLNLSGCGPDAAGALVEFTLVAGVPFIYRFPRVVAEALTFTAPGAAALGDCPVTWIPVGAGRVATVPPVVGCDPPGGCAQDPAAAPVGVLEPVPAPGVCMTRPVSAWAAGTAAPGLIPRWLDSVPIVTVTPGPALLRRLSVRLFASPLLTAITDPDDVDPCSAVAEVNVSYLPPDSTLILDGRTEEAYVQCPGGAREPADHLITGPAGGPFGWPRLVCGANVTVLAMVDAAHYHPDAAVSVELAARTDLG